MVAMETIDRMLLFSVTPGSGHPGQNQGTALSKVDGFVHQLDIMEKSALHWDGEARHEPQCRQQDHMPML